VVLAQLALSHGAYHYLRVPARLSGSSRQRLEHRFPSSDKRCHHLSVFFFVAASNKSAICHEISYALQTVNELFPGRYSASKRNSNDDNDTNTKTMKGKTTMNDFSMVISNATEVGLLSNLARVNTMLLHADGDVSLTKLGYYEQGRNETAAGVSLFCDASDGLRKGFIRGTGISQLTIDRPVALLSMFVASTGTKLAHMLQRFHETKEQDGVFGRVFFTWCRTVVELPLGKIMSFTNVASFSHFACATAMFFENQFEFRHSADGTDFSDRVSESTYFECESENFSTSNVLFCIGIHQEERLLKEMAKQQVTTAATYSVASNARSAPSAGVRSSNDTGENMSSFKLIQILLDDWWKASNSAEHHIKPIRRKVVQMLSKAIWSMKTIRMMFQLMGENLNSIDQQQGDRTTSTCINIDSKFQSAIQSTIEKYLRRECELTGPRKYNMWSTTTDVLHGYQWYLRKMLVMETLLTLRTLPEIIAERNGPQTHDK
jgi:hypothetical protein